MRACFARLAGCTLALTAGYWIFGVPVTAASVLPCGLLLTVFYALVRPISQLVLLPLNLFVLGLASLFADALLVLWAIHWTPGPALNYLQALCIAALAALCHLPFALGRRAETLARLRGA